MNNSVGAARKTAYTEELSPRIERRCTICRAISYAEHPDRCFSTVRGICTLIMTRIRLYEHSRMAYSPDTGTRDSLIYHPIFECGAFQSSPEFTQQPTAPFDLIQWRSRSRVDGSRDKQPPNYLSVPSSFFFAVHPWTHLQSFSPLLLDLPSFPAPRRDESQSRKKAERNHYLLSYKI